jgi:salicylate hydroxylase
MKILIAGAGIGGLAAAANLLKNGHDVQIYEQAPALTEVGAGVQMSANAVKVLRHIGMGEMLERTGVKPASYVFRLFDTGEVLQTFPLAETHEELCGAPYYQMHRADLLNGLIDSVTSFGEGRIHLSKKIVDVDEGSDQATLQFADGTSASGDLIVGADGVKSVVREKLLGNEPADFTEEVAWRIIVPTIKLPPNLFDQVMTVWVGPGRHGVIYYLRGGELLNFVGCVTNPDWTSTSWTEKSDWTELIADFEGWNESLMTVLNAADKDECYRWALYKRPVAKKWSSQRVTMLGDAVHATLPYLAQGAAMAIEDGAVLARALDQEGSLPEALSLYERNRVDRTSRIVRESSDNAVLFHLPSTEDLREAFAAREMGKERNNWLYNYDPLSVELT